MKRIALFVAIAFTTAASVRAQIPDPGDPVCAHCEVDLKSQQPHKPSCPYYSEPANEKGTVITTRPYRGKRADIRAIPDGIYTLRSVNKKGVTHRVGMVYIRRLSHR